MAAFGRRGSSTHPESLKKVETVTSETKVTRRTAVTILTRGRPPRAAARAAPLWPSGEAFSLDACLAFRTCRMSLYLNQRLLAYQPLTTITNMAPAAAAAMQGV